MAQSGYDCPCGGTEYLEVWHGPLLHTGLTRRFTAVACIRCGLSSLWPPVTEEELASVMANRGWRDIHLPQASWCPIRSVRTIAGRYFEDLVRTQQPPPGRVLDIGTGTGGMAGSLQQSGYEVLGLEPEESMAAEARDKGLQVAVTTFEEWTPTPEPFDVVLMSNVLEHVDQPLVVLQKIKTVLAPGGRLFIEVPNIERPKTSYRRSYQVAHRWYFSPASLRGLLGEAGLQPVYQQVFRLDCFQTVAGHADDSTPLLLDPQAGRRVRDCLQRHRWLYYARLQFVWRKIPGLRDKLIFGVPQPERWA
jgi:SAM-dependent methyltransferase